MSLHKQFDREEAGFIDRHSVDRSLVGLDIYDLTVRRHRSLGQREFDKVMIAAADLSNRNFRFDAFLCDQCGKRIFEGSGEFCKTIMPILLKVGLLSTNSFPLFLSVMKFSEPL